MEFGGLFGSGSCLSSPGSQPKAKQMPISRQLPFRIEDSEELRQWLAANLQKQSPAATRDVHASQIGPFSKSLGSAVNFDRAAAAPTSRALFHTSAGANVGQKRKRIEEQSLEGQEKAKDSHIPPEKSPRSASSSTSAAASPSSYRSFDALQRPGSSINHQQLLSKLEELQNTQFGQQQWVKMFRQEYGITANSKCKFRQFRLSKTGNWVFVRPLEKVDLAGLSFPTIPMANVAFFYNLDSCLISWHIPQELENDKAVKWLWAEPLALCLGNNLLEFICTLEQADVCHPFDYLNTNCAKSKREQHILKFYNDPKLHMKRKRQSHVYLLLDPRGLDLDCSAKNSFFQFLKAIFYIGKGTGMRSTEHLSQTVNRYRPALMCAFGASYKKSRIREIWDSGNGVLILQTFLNISDDEALFREYLMIRARFSHGTPANDSNWNGGMGMFNTDCPDIILGPLCIANKKHSYYDEDNTIFDTDNKEIKLKLRESPIFKQLQMDQEGWTDLGVRMLYRAYLAFLIDRLQPQYECNVEDWQILECRRHKYWQYQKQQQQLQQQRTPTQLQQSKSGLSGGLSSPGSGNKPIYPATPGHASPAGASSVSNGSDSSKKRAIQRLT